MLALAAIVAVGFAVEAAAGFGSTLIILGLAGLILPLPHLLRVVVPVNLVLSAWLLARDWRACDVRLLARRVLPVMAVGLALGLVLARVVRGEALTSWYALFLVVLSVIELWKAAAPPEGGGWRQAGWLFAAGIIHGLFAASGPLVVVALTRSEVDKRSFRATLAALWLVLNAAFLATQAAAGAFAPSELRESVLLLPAMAIGLGVGSALHARLDLARFRQLVFGTLLAGGMAMLALGR